MLGASLCATLVLVALVVGPLTTTTETALAPGGPQADAPAGAEALPGGGGPAPSTDVEGAVPGEVLVRFRSDADAEERTVARKSAGTTLEQPLPAPGLQLVSVDSGSVGQGVAKLEASPDVLYAEPNYRRAPTRTPNDTFFPRLWGLDNTAQDFGTGRRGTLDADIDAPEAWERQTGDRSVKVAVIDTGVADHPDLRSNVWTNPDEIPGNGVDDDRNGYVDDVRGWDFVGGPSSEGNVTDDDAEGHGTHVAGTIGADGDNGAGVTGVNWDVSLMPLQILGPDGGSVADAIQAYDYARVKGARVINASFGGASASRTEHDAIARLSGTLFVAAAGNDGANNDDPAQALFPCSYDLDNVLCVAASDENDRIASFSNYGCQSVDLAAPGVDTASTAPGGGYRYMSGTSMATPHVAGAAALVLASEGGLSVAELKARLLQGVDRGPALASTASGGRLNVDNALRGLVTAQEATPCGPPAAAPGPAAQASPSPAPTPQPAPEAPSSGSGDSGGGSSSGDSGSSGSDSGAVPAPPAPAVAPPTPATPVRRSACSRLSGRRRTVCVKRARALARCAKLSGSRRTACVRAARRIRR